LYPVVNFLKFVTEVFISVVA